MKKIVCALLVLLLVPIVQAGIIYEDRTKEIPYITYIRYPTENIYWKVIDVDKFEYWATIKQDRFGEYSGNGKIKVKGVINGKDIKINYDLGNILEVNPHYDGQWFKFNTKINVNYDNKRTKYQTTVHIVIRESECYFVISGNWQDEFNGIIFFNGCGG